MKLQKSLILTILAFSVNSFAFTESINTNQLAVNQSKQIIDGHSFDSFTETEFAMSKDIGQASVPSKTYLIAAHPAQFEINVKYINPITHTKVRLAPAVPEKCRCIDDLTNAKRNFSFSENVYQQQQELVSKTYLGTYRGTPVTKVDVRLAEYDATKQTLKTYDQVKVSTDASLFRFLGLDANVVVKSFLIVAPAGWESAIADFANYKKSLGFNVIVDTVSFPENTTIAIQNKIKKYYSDSNIDFAMLIGDENALPMFSLATSASSMTPSDLPYFTMDGNNDTVPDVLSSRIVASSASAAKTQLDRLMDQERRNVVMSSAKNVIGIASDEGYAPSDAEYITAINNSLSEHWRGNVSYFYQGNQNSNPVALNAAFNSGAFWLTYIGHGSGYAWPSMFEMYSTEDIRGVKNAELNQPVIIDVACQNGRLTNDHLGGQFMNPSSREAKNGASAYYGGSVNISWHPPAIMARGIAFEHMKQNFNYLGEALLAGQLYLTNNWDSSEDTIDNMEWYHLQGDPSFSIRY